MHHNRKSIRLRHHDYSSAGAYFITICLQDRAPLFGHVGDLGTHLSALGRIVEKRWREIPGRFRHVQIDVYVVMPDHFHGIVILHALPHHEAELTTPTSLRRVRPLSISTIVQSFKANVTRDCKSHGIASFQWQRNYYERRLRDENDLNNVRTYIQNNPARWLEKRGVAPGPE